MNKMACVKRNLQKYLWMSVVVQALVSCTTDEDSLPFNIPSNEAETVRVEFSAPSSAQPFNYLVLAEKIIADWGDGSPSEAYLRGGSSEDWQGIRPLMHAYAERGTYNVAISTLRPYAFNFSQSVSPYPDTRITKLELSGCRSLSRLFCRNQPISRLDLSDCVNLEQIDVTSSQIANLVLPEGNQIKKLYIDSTALTSFDCSIVPLAESLKIGTAGTPMRLTNVQTLKNLQMLVVKANIAEATLDLSQNDSLQTFMAVDANLVRVGFDQLSLLTAIAFFGCNGLESVDLGSNPMLKSVTLTGNAGLSAQALDNLFRSLPPATAGQERRLSLAGNAGDADCDRSIATRKGWVFD